ncbi:MAG TPA: kelch repeat-containing protein [Thermoplasmata archaeon]|nr:kelch repeat-containing protein [Thermoplasmata archaeon]
MVWDSGDGYGLLFGGEYYNESSFHTVYYNDTWTYLGGHWTNVTSGHGPSERFGASMADDPADHEVILFGGQNSHGRDLNDTWAWSAGTWTNVTPTGSSKSPPAGFWSSMTYDAATSSVLLFGGINESSQYGNDTWSFKAGTWTQFFPTHLPPGRHAQEMVYDAASSEVVMFGGLGSTTYLNDTWTYQSGNWAPIAAGNHPGARVGPGIVYDSDQSMVVLYGGQPASFDYYSTWLFSSGAWAQYNLSTNPPNPTNPWGQMIYDPTDHYVFLFYEEDGSGPTMETWALTVSTSGPSPIQASLGANPSSIALGQSTTFSTVASGGTGTYHYAYSTLPPGCVTQNVSSLVCTPTAAGTYVVGVNVTDTGSGHAAATTTLTVTSSTGPPPIQASLSADPSSIDLGVTTTLKVTATGGTGTYSYDYSTLPSGCTTANTSSLSCTPTTAGTYVIGVNVTDTGSGHASATTTLVVTKSSSTPPSNTSSSSGSPVSGWEWIVLVVVIVVAALVGVILYRRRRQPPAATSVPAPPS